MAERRFYHRLGIIAAVAAGVWLLAAFGLGILLPFLLGYLAARLAEPLVGKLAARGSLPRWLCSGLGVTLVLLALLLAVLVLGGLLWRELTGLARGLPTLAAELTHSLERLQTWLLNRTRSAPPELAQALETWTQRLFTSSSLILEKGSELLLGTATGMIVALPDLFLFTVTAVLASFMISARLPQLRRSLQRWLPKGWRAQVRTGIQGLKTALGGWLKAQCKLMGITFGILTVGLLVLRVRYPLLVAAVTALVDTLPVLGIGTVLIPWAVLCFLQQETTRAVGLLILYGAAALTRTGLEPKLIGKQMGLSPLLTLLAMYAGYQLCGLLGMILFPVGALLLRQCLDLVEQPEISPKEP